MQTTSVPPKGLLSEMQPVSIAEETVKAEPTSPFNCILNKASTCILDSPTDSEKQECQEFIARKPRHLLSGSTDIGCTGKVHHHTELM